MNGRKRARWYADVISDLQRAHKQARGSSDASLISEAIAKLQTARLHALADVSNDTGNANDD
jgi:hypothetical protein